MKFPRRTLLHLAAGAEGSHPRGLEKRSTPFRIYETSPAYFFPNRYPVAPQRQLAGLGTRYPDARLGPDAL
jgi:hypothetical protein